MINVSNLNFTYKKTNTKAIRGIDFDIKKGEIFGFLGPSGAGKTTTQHLIIGLLRGYKGNIQVFDSERKDWGKDYFEKIGVAFDFPNLYEKLSAKENLKLIGSYYKNNCDDFENLLDKVGLIPDMHRKVEGFSKGMKMRLNFVRSIMHKPELLFFDEPTSGLDPVNAKIIKDMIIKMKKEGKTIFLTTHNMTVAEQLCDRVAFIVDGKISVIDSPDELKVKHGNKTVKLEYYDESSSKLNEYSFDEIPYNDSFFNILKTKKLKTIHSQEATLEDIFIKLTGRELN